ncbi:hypothetical protein AMTR_s00039p00094170 [Amborella trichopoda]|uniref:Uncharacterized protein n=1 Tax=Amborella trichopoda TaxID=13333 RepID=U5D0J4_AMBTC|nr:hypothetical protein AMTR_s00039p00094170 [Amborella trichopoda]
MVKVQETLQPKSSNDEEVWRVWKGGQDSFFRKKNTDVKGGRFDVLADLGDGGEVQDASNKEGTNDRDKLEPLHQESDVAGDSLSEPPNAIVNVDHVSKLDNSDEYGISSTTLMDCMKDDKAPLFSPLDGRVYNDGP